MKSASAHIRRPDPPVLQFVELASGGQATNRAPKFIQLAFVIVIANRGGLAANLVTCFVLKDEG